MKHHLTFITIIIVLVVVQNAYSQDKPESVTGGIVNGKATYLPKPLYPEEAKNACAAGLVKVEVLISEDGEVISAKAISGNELLRDSSVEAAKKAKFGQTPEIPIEVRGIIVYNFDALAKCITAGIVNKKALKIPKPSLPHSGHPSHLKLEEDKIVVIEIVIDSGSGKVTYAKAIVGHPLLRVVSERSARLAEFAPANGSPVKVKALLAYKFKTDRTIETDIEEDDKDVLGIPNDLVKPKPPFCNCKFPGNSTVLIEAEVNERGSVIKAEALSGHPLLKKISKMAALQSIFIPTNIKSKIRIVYEFEAFNKNRDARISNVYVKEVSIEKQR